MQIHKLWILKKINHGAFKTTKQHNSLSPQMFLEQQISILEWFLIMLKIQLCITEICIKIETVILNNISLYYCFYCIFDQINAALLS